MIFLQFISQRAIFSEIYFSAIFQRFIFQRLAFILIHNDMLQKHFRMTDSIEPTFWENPEGVKLACYEWLPSSEPSFILYIGIILFNSTTGFNLIKIV